MSRQLPNSKSDTLSMEINGTPYYVASKEGVPYLYDVDTREEVGYWSSKKGQYIMFSLYNKMMKKKYENLSDSSESTYEFETIQQKSESESDSGSRTEEKEESESDSDSESRTEENEESDSESRTEEKDESESDSDSESRTEEKDESESDSDSEPGSQEEIQIKKNHLNTMFMFTFLILFVYLTLQKEFQSIYFDFIFLICINLLNIFKVFEMLDDER